MSQEVKKSIAVSVSIFIVLIAYYGSYMPMKKSVLFISAMGNASTMRTVDDFEKNFSVPLDVPSPIGQEELVRSMTNMLANSLQNVPDKNAIKELIKYVNSYYKPIIDRNRGMSFGQDIYILGAMNEFAYIKTGDKAYLSEAEVYFKKETELGPSRPQGLYGLVDVYRMESKFDDFKVIAAKIISQWPADSKTQGMIDQVNAYLGQQSGKK